MEVDSICLSRSYAHIAQRQMDTVSHLSYSTFLKPPLRVCMDRARMAETLFHLCKCASLLFLFLVVLFSGSIYNMNPYDLHKRPFLCCKPARTHTQISAILDVQFMNVCHCTVECRITALACTVCIFARADIFGCKWMIECEEAEGKQEKGSVHLAVPGVKAQEQIEAWSWGPSDEWGGVRGWDRHYSAPKWTIVNTVCGMWPIDWHSTHRHT